MERGYGSAFPEQYKNQDGSIDPVPGLTKREYFALHAMEGMLANGNLETWMDVRDIPKEAVKIADELLKLLNS